MAKLDITGTVSYTSLQGNVALYGVPPEYPLYLTRVLADSGGIQSNYNTYFLLNGLYSIYGPTAFKLIWTGEMGTKARTATVYKYATKAYSADTLATHNDLVQATELSQPFLSGNIAPNEKQCLSNPNGGTRSMSHPTISFAANEAWTMSIVMRWDGNISTSGFAGSANSDFFCSRGAYMKYSFINSLGTFVETGTNGESAKIAGKNAVLTIVALGNDTLSFYVNGVFLKTMSVITSVDFSKLMSGSLGSYHSGKVTGYFIKAGASSQTQITTEYNLLRSIYPEIESVVIGTQEWATSNCDMVATPQGNIIPEMQGNTAVEKITVASDRDFSSDTGFWTLQTGWVISGGKANFSGATNGGLIKFGLTTVGKYYKYTFDLIVTSGSVRIQNTSGNYIYSSTQTVSVIVKHTVLNTYLMASANSVLSIDNISIQELGWANSTEIYDAVYAATAGSAAVKELAAVKEAAMWCYYNNDNVVGSIYGKLYNWYAVRLLQLDIDAYNAANPTALWGWKVPASTDFTTLATYLGGASVAGGKMKVVGTTYWTTPNLGADNSSGFSAIGGGDRQGGGSFALLNTNSVFWCSDSPAKAIFPQYDVANLYVSLVTNLYGCSLRLIKA